MDHLPQAAVLDLSRRVLGAQAAASVSIELAPADERGYSYEWRDGRLLVRASDSISAAVGLRSYLRRELAHDLQWATELPLAVELRPCAPQAGVARVREQYMYNFCTYSYTTAHWTWETWEREIDWMALHGITMPLALVGHESVLAEAWHRLGVADDEVRRFLGDPIYAPFQFMGCLDGDHAVMTVEWLEERHELGRRILDRCRALGMRPILPAFTGHVPAGWADNATTGREWQGNTTRFLDPEDERFRQVAATITRVQQELLGDAEHFAADPFIEMHPVDDGSDFPALVGRRIIEGITDEIPGAVWVMQAWPFSYQRAYWTDERIAAFLDGIRDDRLLVLDLWAESDPIWRIADGFRGKDWHWCGLLNFGGRSDAVADLPRAISEFERAIASPHPPTGVGLAMESSHHNPVFFELLCDLAWGAVDDLPAWVAEFGVRRYGIDDARVRAGWAALLDTVYDARGSLIFPEDFHGVLTKRADLVDARNATDFRRRAEVMMWFDPARLLAGWSTLTDLLDQRRELASGPLGLDLIEIAQAAGTRIVDEYCARILEAADDKTRDAQLNELLRAVDILDTLLACRTESRLDTAESEAERAATGGVDPDSLLAAQRRILTSWNTTPGTDLDDYSGRIWHGLVGGYYRRRLVAWSRSVSARAAGDVTADLRLSEELDDIWEQFMTVGALDRNSAEADLVSASRALQTRFEVAFDLDDLR